MDMKLEIPSEVSWNGNPQIGKEFTRKLLGHKSEKMTDKYLDTRGKEYVML
ncbi:hypothetical protein [Yersinia kristensenii]|uniref:hypothetical protein n=1 Tax=Yersinia kristensenii TaxID=28152 RepID=UPI0012FD28F6